MAKTYLSNLPDDADISANVQEHDTRRQRTFNRSREQVNHSFMLQVNPTISALAKGMRGDQKAKGDLSDECIVAESSDNDVEGNVHHPEPLALRSRSFGHALGHQHHLPQPRTVTPQNQNSPAPTILRESYGPIPSGYCTNYRARHPTDTQFHRGSAGIDPLGAHNRRIHLSNTLLRSSQAGVTPRYRIVSGSFGSFGPSKPSRFDEREYRLFPANSGAGVGEKRKRGEGTGSRSV